MSDSNYSDNPPKFQHKYFSHIEKKTMLSSKKLFYSFRLNTIKGSGSFHYTQGGASKNPSHDRRLIKSHYPESELSEDE